MATNPGTNTTIIVYLKIVTLSYKLVMRKFLYENLALNEMYNFSVPNIFIYSLLDS